MKLKALLLIIPIALMSCADIRTESSAQLNEKAVVVTLIYSPSEHHTDVTPTMYNMGPMGVDYNGNSGISLGKHLQITETNIPEKFGVAFQCQHGTFTIEGSDTKYKVLHDKMAKLIGDTVSIIYKEEYLVTYEKKNDKSVPVKRVLNRLDFIDAQK